MRKRELVMGQEFGDYTVISEPFYEGKYRKIEVKCQCGKIRKVYCDSVNRLKQCKKCTSNDQRKFQLGQEIANFTVIGNRYDKNKDYSYYIVQCKCGSEPYEISAWELKKTKSCRLCFQPIGNNHPSYKGTKNVSKTYFSQVVLGAKSRNLEFDISIEDMENQFVEQLGLCYYTKLPIEIGNEKVIGTASLDRVDSSKGYTKNNIQWVHKDINRMKTDFSQEYFVKLCQLVVNQIHQDYGNQELGK